MSDVLLQVENLRVYFPVYGGVLQRIVGRLHAVDSVSFTLHRGETLGLVGESGSGKTTVGRSLVGIVAHTAPDVLLGGHAWFYADHANPEPADLLQLFAHRRKYPRQLRLHYRRHIQMVFQDPFSSLNPRLSVGQIIAEPLEIHFPKLSRTETQERVVWLLEKVGLQPEDRMRYPHEFSGGQRQRIGLARALATHPDLVICDEPVSALDVSIQAQVINLMEDLQEEFGMAYLFIAHDLSVVHHISDRIAVMYLGHIVELGPADDVYFTPKHPYTQALISAVPIANPRQKRERIVLRGEIPSPLRKPSGCPFHPRCPIAQPECSEIVPELEEKAPGHWVACPYA
ncbi:MAG: ATP-binding cassette domain-containing protein [Bacteroidota bacterium]|nr:ATP-binding cassette domain-containing protein [Bacteroidota bacterium]